MFSSTVVAGKEIELLKDHTDVGTLPTNVCFDHFVQPAVTVTVSDEFLTNADETPSTTRSG